MDIPEKVSALLRGDLAFAAGEVFLHDLYARWRTARLARLREEIAALQVPLRAPGGPAARNNGRPLPPGAYETAVKAVDLDEKRGKLYVTMAVRTPTKGRRKRRPPTATPALVRARKVQGKYLGCLKQLGDGKDRRRVKAVAKADGVPAAVALGRQLLQRRARA